MEEFLTSVYAIEERIRSKRPTNMLYYSKKNDKTKHLISLAERFNVSSKEVSREEIREYGAFYVALSIPAESLKGGTQWLKQEIKKLKDLPLATIVLLDGITDTHNIGAILRSCVLFDVNLVIYPERRAASGDGNIISRISAGGSEIINHGTVVNLNYAIQLLKENGFWIYGTDLTGTNIRTLERDSKKIAKHYALVLGSEHKGLSNQVKLNCDEILTIPINKTLNSLNVSVANGIFLYALQKQADKIQHVTNQKPKIKTKNINYSKKLPKDKLKKRGNDHDQFTPTKRKTRSVQGKYQK